MKIAMYDLEGHLLEVFDVDTVAELERQLKVNKHTIQNCISGRSIKTMNRQFRKFPDIVTEQKRIGDVTNIPGRTSNIPVSKYYNGIYICSYDNMTIAAYKNNCHTSAISECLTGKRKTTDSFEWKHAN